MADLMPEPVQMFDLPDVDQPRALFDGPEDQTQPVKTPPEQVKMTSTLATFAQQMNDMSADTMSNLQQINEDKINRGKEEQLRENLALQQQTSRIADLQRLQADALKVNPKDYSVSDAFREEQAAVTAPLNTAALEQDGAHAMAGTQPTGDSAALSAYLGGARRVQTDFAAKMAVFNSEMAKLKSDADGEGTLASTADFLFRLTGFEDLLVGAHAIAGQGTYFKAPAKNFNDQANFLWSQDPAHFRQYLTDAIQHGKAFWGAGPTYDTLTRYAGGPIGMVGQSALSYNFWTYAGPLSYIPLAKMTRFASGLARAVGNRELAVNMVTAGMAAKTAGVASGLEHVQPIEATIAETIPSVSVPDTLSLARGDVGVVSDVADRLAALKASTDAVKATLQKTQRVEASQVREMIERGVKEIEQTYRDSPVADIKRSVSEPDIRFGSPEKFGPPNKPFVQTHPVDAREFVGTDSREMPRGYDRFTSEQADQIMSGHHLYADEVHEGPYTLDEANAITHDHLYLDEFDVDHLAALNEEGELRPAAAIKTEGQSKVRFEVDNDTDIDTLSHWNARGEIYHDTLADKTFRTNPFVLQQEHDLEVATLSREGSQKAMTPKGGTGEQPRLVVARKHDDGSIQYGEPGQIHAELLGENEPANMTLNMGFAYPGGPFMSRMEAAKHVHDLGDPSLINHGSRLESVRYYEGISPSFGKKGLKSEVYDRDLNKNGGPETGNLGGVRSIPELLRSPTTGLYSLKFYIGKDQTTGGFLTAEGAAAAAIRRGFLNPKVMQTLDGQWFIQANHVLAESGLTTKVVRAEDFPAVYRPSEFVKSLNGLQTELHNQARIGAVLGKGRFLAQVTGPYVKNIKALSGKQLDTLSSVLRSGEAEAKWFSMPELYDKYNALIGRTPTTKEALAYYSTKELSDTAYHIFNDRLYIPMAREGYETVRITNPEIGLDTDRINGRVVHPDTAKGQRILLAEDGSINDGLRSDLQVLIEGGRYKMVELRSTIKQDGRYVKYILTHEDSLTREPLERQQLNYNAGGSREYANKWFMKQANYIEDDNGHRTWLDPMTHVTGPTRKSLTAYAEGMERARLAYIDPKLTETQKRLIIDTTPIESYDKFAQMVKDGKIHPATPFEVLIDKQQPENMILRPGDTNWTNPSIRGEESYYMTQARLYYGEKGERLTDPSGQLAKTLNPLSTLRKAVYNAAQTGALGDYNTKVIEDWARAAEPYLDHSTVGIHPTPWDMFFNGKFIKGLSPEKQRLVSGMDIARNAHKRFMGMRDLEQTTQTMYLKKLGLALENKGTLGEKAAEAVYSRLNADPIGVARDLVFHGYFGFLNLRRFVLHASQAVGAMAVDPVRGLNAAGMAPVTAALVHINRSDAVMDYFARKLGQSGQLGMDFNDYKDMVRSLRYSGWLNIGGEVAQLDRYSDRFGGTVMTKGWDAIKKVGITPFHAAIGLQRLMGYHMAWGMMREEFPKLDVFGAEFQGRVNNLADTLSGNMTTASSAAWQKGAWGIPTQFMSWQARMMENLLPQTFGGSKVLSQQQKLMYVLGQAALWGTGGIPLIGFGYDFISDMYRENTGQQIDQDTHRAITKGLMDSIIHGFTGSDTDMSSEAGFGSAINRTLTGFRNGQGNPFLQFLGGPVTETGETAVDKFGQFLTYMKAEQTDGLSLAEFKLGLQDTLPLIQSMKFYQKAYWAWKYHNLFDPKTDQPILQQGTTESDAVIAALGIPNLWESVKGPMYQTQQELDETINDVAKQVVKLRREQDSAIEQGDTDKMRQIENIVRVVMQPYRDRPLMQQEIAKRATEYMTRGYTGSEQEQLIQRSIKTTGLPPAEATPADSLGGK